MNHQDLTVELVEMASLSVTDLDDAVLGAAQAALAELVLIDVSANASFDDEGRTGLARR